MTLRPIQLSAFDKKKGAPFGLAKLPLDFIESGRRAQSVRCTHACRQEVMLTGSWIGCCFFTSQSSVFITLSSGVSQLPPALVPSTSSPSGRLAVPSCQLISPSKCNAMQAQF